MSANNVDDTIKTLMHKLLAAADEAHKIRLQVVLDHVHELIVEMFKQSNEVKKQKRLQKRTEKQQRNQELVDRIYDRDTYTLVYYPRVQRIYCFPDPVADDVTAALVSRKAGHFRLACARRCPYVAPVGASLGVVASRVVVFNISQ